MKKISWKPDIRNLRGNDNAIGLLLTIFLFILGIVVLVAVLVLVFGPIMFVGMCLLIACAFILLMRKGKIPEFNIRRPRPFYLLLFFGLLLIGLSAIGMEIVSPEFTGIQQSIANLFGGI